MIDNLFYVYEHRKRSDNLRFYIGRGCKNRFKSKHSRSSYWNNIVNKHGFTPKILMSDLSFEESKELEVFLIQESKEFGDTLCNHTDGGEGVTGYKHTDESKSKISKANSGTVFSEEHKDKIRESNKGQKRPWIIESNKRESVREKRRRCSSIQVLDTKTGITYDSIGKLANHLGVSYVSVSVGIDKGIERYLQFKRLQPKRWTKQIKTS